MRRILSVCLASSSLLWATLTAPAFAQQRQQPAQEEPQAPTEQLLFGPPAGWVSAFDQTAGRMRTMQFLPPGQTPAAWQDMLIVQMRAGQRVPPEAFLGEVPSRIEGDCSEVWLGDIQSGPRNGYPAAFRMVACGLNHHSNMGEFSLFYVVTGKAGIYAFQRAWQVPPFDANSKPISKDTLAAGMRYLESIKVCDTADPAHPCR